MNGWCLLLLVCVGVTAVQGQSPSSLPSFIILKLTEFSKVADRNRDGILEYKDYRLISEFVFNNIPNYPYNASYLYDVITNNSWSAFPDRTLTLQELLDAVSTTPPDVTKAAVYALAASMFEAWNVGKPPNDCLNVKEIGSELENIGKHEDVPSQAELAVYAMTKKKNGCATLGQYQACAWLYLTATDLTEPCNNFFGKLGRW